LRADAGEEAAAAELFREALNVYRYTLGDHSKTADLVMSLGLALLGGEVQVETQKPVLKALGGSA